ncbi:MAG: hypothetical protein N2689_04825, partial [Verrucomicrobiae bacterium]|nr:hypothetical protein [Verrucomicrobiae bacterium]
AQASWNPTWIKDVTGSVFVRQQFFRYNRHTDIDFDASAAGFNAGGAVEDWFTLSGGFTATRLESRPTDDEFYKEGDAALVISRSHKFTDRLVLPYGYTFDYYFTSPDDYTRFTHGVFVGLNWAAMQKMLVQVLYRFQWEDYQRVQREDKASIVSLAVLYQFTNWASARAFVSFTSNDSSIDRDYEIFNSGVGLTLSLKF